jgi:hypothetical protein
MDTAVHASRIKIAVAHLRSIPKDVADKHVNMFMWGTVEDPGQLPVTCGSTACAAGWLTYVPALYAQGLDRDTMGTPTYRRQSGFAALALFFGIPGDRAQAIFSAHSVPTHGKAALNAVCTRLERLL